MVDFIRKDGKVIAIVGDETLPVTNMFDCDGEECELEGAVTAVAGPTKDGDWLTLSVDGPFTRLN